MPNPDIKPSFFDDQGASDDFAFWKPLANTLKKFSDAKHIESNLFKRSKRTSFWKSRHYVLFDDRLAQFKNGRESRETAYCVVQNMRLEIITNSESEKDGKFGIRLIHNRKSMELYARSQEIQEKWIGKLKQFCTLVTYSLQYINIKLIGEGSFAKVYLVKRKADNADMAVKTFDKKLLGSVEKAKASLINEINIMRKLDHENIIKLYEVHESESYIYLVLELLRGGELFERIVKKGIYTEKDAAVLMKKLLSALDYMHSKGMMHRDIKPENLILKDMDNNYDVKIADFGLATVVSQNEYLFRRCGTPGYVAPEILADERYDQKVDVFSAGVILYILLTGGSPFHGKSYNEILIKNKNCDIKFNLKDSGHGISDLAIDLLRKMLQKDPKLRSSAKDCLEHQWLTSGGHPEQTEKPQVTMLSSAQENMRKFQEHHRFNVKKIKPKDLCQAPTPMERSLHCPSPIINGRLSTIVESKRRSPFAGHLDPTKLNIDENDEQDLQADDNEIIEMKMNRYNNNVNNFNLLTNVKEGIHTNSTNSSINTPVVKPRQKPATQKVALGIQGALLGFLRSEPEKQQGPTIRSYFEEKKDDEKDKKDRKITSSVRQNLQNLF